MSTKSSAHTQRAADLARAPRVRRPLVAFDAGTVCSLSVTDAAQCDFRNRTRLSLSTRRRSRMWGRLQLANCTSACRQSQSRSSGAQTIRLVRLVLTYANVERLRRMENIYVLRVILSLVPNVLIVDHVLWCRTELRVSFDHLVYGIEEVLFTDGLPSRSNGEHSSLSANAADICTSVVWAQSCQKLKPNISLTVHCSRVNSEDPSPALQVRQTKLDLAIETTGPNQGRVKSVRSISRHENLNVAPRIESVQLVDHLEHGTLHLVVSTGAIIEPSSADSVNLVEEDYAPARAPKKRQAH